MSAELNPSPLPAPAPAGNPVPTLNLVPPPESPRARSFLNQRQTQKLVMCKAVCLAAQESAHVAVLEGRGIAAPFVTQLLVRLETALVCGTNAACFTDRKEGATVAEEDVATALKEKLRAAQAAARQTYAATNPAKLGEYLIGDRIDANRATLDNAAQGILARINEERPQGIDTGFIDALTAQRQSLTAKNTAQAQEQERATAERTTRDALVNTILTDTRKIQYAADAAWPPQRGNAAARRRFRIPANRPFAPRTA